MNALNMPKVIPEIAEYQQNYLAAVLAGSGRQADKVVEAALENNVAVNQVYLDIFQHTGYKIGELWQRNEISVAREHLATAIIERQMGELHPLFKSQANRGKNLVIGCVDQEYHRVGARMVADFFEQDGWAVYYLGAAVPGETFIAMAREARADMIGLSSQMVYHLSAVVEFVKLIDRQGMAGIPIMVGGLPFVQNPELYTKLGVHFSGRNAKEALSRANRYFDLPDASEEIHS